MLANLRLKFKAVKKYTKQYEILKLNNPQIRKNYEVEIGGRFAPLLSLQDTDVDVETTWSDVKKAFDETSKEILGYRIPKQDKPWISDEVLQLS